MSLTVAIIDRGIDFSHPKLENCNYEQVLVPSNIACDIVFSKDINTDDTGHGTAIAGIIHKFSRNTKIIGVKLSTPPDSIITESHLARAINWCADQDNIDIINISMGVATNTPSIELFSACKRVIDNKKIIIASVHNFPYLKCYPSYFPFVIGVGSGLVKSRNEFGYTGPGACNILAKGTVQRVIWRNGEYRLTSGTSYAAPHFVGILCNILLDNRDALKKVEQLISDNASSNVEVLNYIDKSENSVIGDWDEIDFKGRNYFTFQHKFKNVKNLAIFPSCEKEMRTLLELEESLSFKLALLIDYPRAYSNHSFSPLAKGTIRRELNSNDIDRFDTLVLGYFLDQPFDGNIMFGFNLIKACVTSNKNFIVWDYNVYEYLKKHIAEHASTYKGNLYFFYVDDNLYAKICRYKFLPELKTPVLTVAGTGSKQGKITTQIRIKEILNVAGYKTSHLSTEPQGALFGADFLFPYGFNSSVYLDLNRWTELLQYTLKGVQHYKSPDIIISGTQGGVIPRRPGVITNYDASPLRTLQFLFGIQPDALIFTVNPYDDIGFIKKTIDATHNFCSAEVLFLAVTPWTLEFKLEYQRRMLGIEEYAKCIDNLKRELNIPVLDVMNNSNSALILELIEKAFTPID